MQTLKYELFIVGAALFALGGYVAMQTAGAAQLEPEPVLSFTAGDYSAFDRDFSIGDQMCEVGLAAHRLCLAPSPIESRLRVGHVLEPEVPILAAEFRVIVETELKHESLRTVRFGQTLALIEPHSRTIRDLMRLNAADFASSREAPMTP